MCCIYWADQCTAYIVTCIAMQAVLCISPTVLLTGMLHMQAVEDALSSAGAPPLPGYLQKVLQAAGKTDNPHQLLLLVLHAVMLETGLQLADMVRDLQA